MVNINNAHAGLSSASVLAKFDMEGFTSCPRLSPHSSFLSLFSTVSLPLHPSLSFSIPGSERQPYGSEAYSDRKMWPISSNWRSSGGWVSRGEGGGEGVAAAWSIPRTVEVGMQAGRQAGRQALHPPQLLTAQWRPSRRAQDVLLQEQSSSVQVTPRAPQNSRHIQLNHNYPFSRLSAG